MPEVRGPRVATRADRKEQGIPRASRDSTRWPRSLSVPGLLYPLRSFPSCRMHPSSSFPAVRTPLVIFDGLGWVGAACVLVPYALVSTGRLSGTAPSFRVFNIVGGVLLMLNTWYHRAYPSMIVNVIWIAIGFYAMTRRGPDSGA